MSDTRSTPAKDLKPGDRVVLPSTVINSADAQRIVTVNQVERKNRAIPGPDMVAVLWEETLADRARSRIPAHTIVRVIKES